jgi:uncharacterized membrane protein
MDQRKEFQKIDGIKVPREIPLERESPFRSIAKAISWRIIASLTTFIIFLYTPGANFALEVLTGAVAVEAASKMLIYFFHERLWAHIHWGRNWMKYKLIRRIKLEYIRLKRRRAQIKVKLND